MAAMIAVKIEQRPTPKVVAARFVSVSKAKEFSEFGNFVGYVRAEVLTENEAALCGPVLSIEVAGNSDFKGHKINKTDSVVGILDLGVTSILVLVEPLADPARHTLSLMDLVRMPVLPSIPVWSDDGHPAYNKVYKDLTGMLVADGVKGFKNPSSGKIFLVKTVKLLFSLSTHWEALSHRGCPLPECLAFSQGANDFNRKGQKVTRVTSSNIRPGRLVGQTPSSTGMGVVAQLS
jgi:hypothetical protein